MSATEQSECVSFLEQLRPGGPWLLTAIIPDGATTTITANNAEQVDAFVREHNGVKNIYYSVNPTRQAMTSKASKADIAAIEFLLSDLDPKSDETPDAAKARYLTALETFTPRPTAIVDSGNGVQVLWRLDHPIELPPGSDALIKDAEARCKAAMAQLGGKAGTQNIDRILRLPGTTNLPNATKLRLGRVPCATKLVMFNGAVCSLDAFPNPPEPQQRQRQQGSRPKKKKKLPLQLRLMLTMQGDPPADTTYETRSHLLWAFIKTALRRLIDENAIIQLCLDQDYSAGSIYQHVEEKGGEEYLKRQIERAANDPDIVDERQRTVIQIERGNLDQDWRKTERALRAAKCPVYVRAGRLVQPLWRWEKARDGHEVLTASFVTLNVARLSDIAAHHAVRFTRYDAREEQVVDIDPPHKLIEQIIEAGHWGFKSVVGIVNTPTMRPDGSILDAPGYDDATQLWYKATGDVTLPPLPDPLTREHGLQGLDVFKQLLVNFAFENDTALSAAIAAIMTPVLRAALKAVPLFAVIATEARTGKTYLVELIAIIATGHAPVPTAGHPNPEEMEKRIETAALSGRPIIHLNNLENGQVLQSVGLAQLSSESCLTIRKLGRHAEGLCDCRATTIFLNGNNISVAADLVPRTVVIQLDAMSEEPEKRTFSFDPIAKVREDRGKYIAAVFTIVKAFMAAGRPKQKVHNVTGYESWSRMVQEALVWLGMPDPLGAMPAMRSIDPTVDELKRLIEALRKHFAAGQQFTTADCLKLAEEKINTAQGEKWKNSELQAIMTFKGRVSSVEFGNLLRKYRGRFFDGWRVMVGGKESHSKANFYYLQEQQPSAQTPEPPQSDPSPEAEEPF